MTRLDSTTIEYIPAGKEKIVPGPSGAYIDVSSGILFRVSVKLLLAARGTEIVVLPFIFADELCSLFIHGHLTDWINSHVFRTSGITFCHSRYIGSAGTRGKTQGPGGSPLWEGGKQRSM